MRMLQLLRARPSNTNQVATTLGIDYKTAQHHLRVLQQNGLVEPTRGYAPAFLLTSDMEANLEEFDRIAATLKQAPPSDPPDTAPGRPADE